MRSRLFCVKSSCNISTDRKLEKGGLLSSPPTNFSLEEDDEEIEHPTMRKGLSRKGETLSSQGGMEDAEFQSTIRQDGRIGSEAFFHSD